MVAGQWELGIPLVVEDAIATSPFFVTVEALLILELTIVCILVAVTAHTGLTRFEFLESPRLTSQVTAAASKLLVLAGERPFGLTRVVEAKVFSVSAQPVTGLAASFLEAFPVRVSVAGKACFVLRNRKGPILEQDSVAPLLVALSAFRLFVSKAELKIRGVVIKVASFEGTRFCMAVTTL